jgi:hypothetical protein
MTSSSYPGQRKLRRKRNLCDNKGKILHGAVDVWMMYTWRE